MGGSRSLAVRRLLARMNDVTIALDYAPGVDEFGAGAIGVKRVATLEEKQHWYGKRIAAEYLLTHLPDDRTTSGKPRLRTIYQAQNLSGIRRKF